MLIAALLISALVQVPDPPQPRRQVGKVTAIQSDLVVLSIGADEGVVAGDEFTIYRRAQFIAKATVTHADRKWSAGRITLRKHEPEVGDDATINAIRQDPRDGERELLDELDKLERHLAENPEDKRARESAAEVRRRLEEFRARHGEARRVERQLDELARKLKQAETDEERARLEVEMSDLRAALDFQRRFGGGRGGPMDRAAIDEAMEYAQEFEPDMARRLGELMRLGRIDEAVGMARPLQQRARELTVLKERSPEEYRQRLETAAIERETIKLAEDVRKAKGDERIKARERFLEALGRAFAQREEGRKRQLEALEKQVADLKEMLQKRQANRERIIEKRAQDLLGDDYDW